VKDVFGAEYGVNDIVVYATAQGYSSASGRMRIGRVVKISGRQVTIQPFQQDGAHKPVKYIDTRTGKGIDPYCASRKHIAEDEHYTDKRTGERLTELQMSPYINRDGTPWAPRSYYFDSLRRDNPAYVEHEHREYHHAVLKDYVGTAETKPRVSVIGVSDIAKWAGPVPDGWSE
jgi:hypothetical protein